MEFTFSLKFRLAESPYAAKHTIRLAAWEAEGVRVLADRPGRMRLQVSRSAPSAQLAMRRTMAEARRLFPSSEIIEAGPDYVSLRDVAGIFRVSRQAMRLRMLGDGHRFPSPVHEVNGGVWHLAELLEWMNPGSGAFFEQRLLEVARAAASINLAVEARRMREVRDRTWGSIDLPRRVERSLSPWRAYLT